MAAKLTDDVKSDKQRLIAALKERIVDNEQNLKWARQQELLAKHMRPTDSLESYVFKMDNLLSVEEDGGSPCGSFHIWSHSIAQVLYPLPRANLMERNRPSSTTRCNLCFASYTD